MNTRAHVSSVARAGVHPPAVGSPARRFVAMPADLDIDCTDADRIALAARIVACCHDGLADDAVSRWAVRDRTAALLRVARATFGDTLVREVPCVDPGCRQAIELALPIAPLVAVDEGETRFTWRSADDRTLLVRLPTGDDQRAWQRAGEDPEVERRIASSLVVAVDGAPRPADWQLPPAWLAPLADELSRRDPLTDFRVDVACPWCGAPNAHALDLERVVLDNLAAEQRRAVRDVHELARHYHWDEADILAMPPSRRAAYLARIREEDDA